ncbi:dihydrofolate reductase [Collinsella sp. An2]|uniref:dihydrofolate reductase n=1 Tax=Collinsella sp. An2 TaxID=1965585 RepID=UPI00194F7CA1|nr:dihydrofolate reductase [Collinsella sp. An2]
MSRKLSAIVAVCDDWGIGRDGDMVVANRADMRHFVRCTTGHTVIMGRKTLESFPGGRPLKDRRNIVLTRDETFVREGAEVVHSVDEALSALADEEEAWIIGGGEVYRLMLPYCSKAVVTKNHCVRPADTYFPNLDDDPSWQQVESSPVEQIGAGEGDKGISYSFVTYERVDEPEGARQ